MADTRGADLWYKTAVVYGLDVHTFQDSDGDGVGDFPGATSRLDHLADLGITCIWLLPFYPTPDRDNGYDIADYLGVDPRYGTLDDFEAFLRAAGERGIRVFLDLVVNHTSDQHPWFQAARRELPIGDDYLWRNVAAQAGDPNSILSLYHRLLELRRSEPALYAGSYSPAGAGDHWLAYLRHFADRRFLVVLNLGAESETVVPDGGPFAGRVVLSTHPDRDGKAIRGPVALRGDEAVVIAVGDQLGTARDSQATRLVG